MTFPVAPDHMKEFSNQSVKTFGYDKGRKIDYVFNSLGYRSTLEFVDDSNPIILLGNSVTFGIGLNVDDTFAGIISKKISNPVYNFAWGCYAHTNHEQLDLLDNIVKNIKPKHIVFQINNLDRIRQNGKIVYNNPKNLILSQFDDFYKKLKLLLTNVSHTLIYWDDHNYDLDFNKFLIYNKYHLDISIENMPNTFGKKSHKLIAAKILQSL